MEVEWEEENIVKNQARLRMERIVLYRGKRHKQMSTMTMEESKMKEKKSKWTPQ